MYPNLPVRLDFSSVIFPRKGETFCTGVEFLLAVRLGCTIEIRGGYWIPFKSQKTSLKNTSRGSSIKYIREPFLVEQIATFTKALQVEELKINRNQSDGKNYRYLKKKLLSEECKKFGEITQFFSVVEKVLVERIKYPKGSYMNLLYKFIANAGIGQMARGLNQKSRYDLASDSQKPIPAGELVSPLYAG